MALAATSVSPFATVGIEHDSNVFMLPSDFPGFTSSGLTGLGDTIQSYEAGLATKLDWGQDRLSFDGESTRYIYDRFSSLDHYEYGFGGVLDWRLGPIVDGSVNYRQTRVMAPFTDTLSLELLLNTERTASATVRVLVSPNWRLDLTPELHQLDTPLPGFADFRLRETIGTLGVDYLGFGRLTAGLQVDYDHGRYDGIVGATRYNQSDADFTANYKVSGLSTFSASVGYSSRDTSPNPAGSVAVSAANAGAYSGYGGVIGTTSAITGSLSYQRQLTGKTQATVSVLRAVDSYIAGANPEIATGGSVAVTWKPDVKFTVDLSYSLTQDQVQGGLVIANVVNMNERTQVANFDVRYAALSWLTLRPFFIWNQATSTFQFGNYSATTVGIDVTGRPTW